MLGQYLPVASLESMELLTGASSSLTRASDLEVAPIRHILLDVLAAVRNRRERRKMPYLMIILAILV